MTEDVAWRSIDWFHDNGCRVLALMGVEALLRPDFVHKVVYYAAKKGFWVYVATNGRLLRTNFADRLGDAGVSVFNFALDSWDQQPSLPKAVVPAQKNLEHIPRKQYVYRYVVFFNVRDLKQSSRPIFWEVAVEALRFRRDFSHSLPRGSGPTDPAGTTLPRGPHIEGSILNMPKASTIARRGPNGCHMTVVNCGAIDA